MDIAQVLLRCPEEDSKKVFRIAVDFSRYPTGRYLSDHHDSGERLRKEYLIPILDHGIPVIIDLDGTRGYGSNFLEEAFGGLLRDGYDLIKIMDTFTFRSSDKSLILEITEYMRG